MRKLIDRLINTYNELKNRLVPAYNKLETAYNKMIEHPKYKQFMEFVTSKKFVDSLTYIVFPLLIAGLGFLVVQSILQPVKFQTAVEFREKVAIERLKNIRTLQDAYKTENGEFTPSIDTLINFYNNGKITIVRQVGSSDDSLAVAQNLVIRDSIRVSVRDTLLNNMPNFVIDSLRYIPFSGRDNIMMDAAVKSVSGVEVPLFEASVPYMRLLEGLNYQLTINLCAQREDLSRYAGLRVGSISSPNNNAGNWE